MEYIVKELHLPEEDDEPNFVYSELDSGRLNPEPFPENLRELNHPGEVEVRSIPRQMFVEVWTQAQERPDGFMGMFF